MLPVPKVIAESTGNVPFAYVNPVTKVQGAASLGNAPAGTFMFMQTVDTVSQIYQDANGVNWFKCNTKAFANGAFTGPLPDPSPNPNGPGVIVADLFNYTDNDNVSCPNSTYWSLPDRTNNTRFPAGGATGFYSSDAPEYTTTGAPSMQVEELFFGLSCVKIKNSMIGMGCDQSGHMELVCDSDSGSRRLHESDAQPGNSSTPSGLAAFRWWANTAPNFVLAAVQQQ